MIEGERGIRDLGLSGEVGLLMGQIVSDTKLVRA